MRKTKMRLTTACEVREKGRYRPVVIEFHPSMPSALTLRLKGLHGGYTVDVSGLYRYAGACAAEQLRKEKKLAREAKRKTT